MNVSELARRLKKTPNELFEILPEIGFDIGKRAIKIDDSIAYRIIDNWSQLYDKFLKQRDLRGREADTKQISSAEKRRIEVPSYITVRDFAAKAGLPVNKVIAELMKNGIFASLNEEIDYDTAVIVGTDLQLDIQPDASEITEEDHAQDKLASVMEKQAVEDLVSRPPIIVVMGHVDHGKTKLLDAIRRTNVVAGEAGGITQHIGAYQVIRKQRKITFIDTPGHEAFTAMRSRGAKVADIAILVVAADDGVMPQTIEAYRIIQASGVPFLVAINKIDKPEANITKVKQELANQLGITPEDWGGKTICVPVSALAGQGIDDLLDMILLTADMDAGLIKANPASPAIGTIIESRIDKGEGPVATILVQNGTLKIGDNLSFNGVLYGKVRALKNYLGERVDSAGPSTPVKIIGLKVSPSVGDILEVGHGIKADARKLQRARTRRKPQEGGETAVSAAKTVPIVLKADFLGSLEAIEESLEKINTDEVKVNIIYKGLGNISDGDIKRAEAGKALIIGFHVKVPPQISEAARSKNIDIRLFDIIYHLIDSVRADMQSLIGPEFKRTVIGKAQVLAIFKTDKGRQVIGAKITDGLIESGAKASVSRKGEAIASGAITGLKSGREDVSVCDAGSECGIQFDGEPVIEKGDVLEIFKEEEIKKLL